MSGSRRFGKLTEAAREGKTVAPLDLRYLTRQSGHVAQKDETRADVASFLHQLYHSCAETLPDVRDDPLSPQEEIDLAESDAKHDEPDLDPYAQKLAAVASGAEVLPAKDSGKKRRKLRKGVRVNPLRSDEEVRYLPPGCMKDHWDQYRLVSVLEKPASFPTFWRVAGPCVRSFLFPL